MLLSSCSTVFVTAVIVAVLVFDSNLFIMNATALNRMITTLKSMMEIWEIIKKTIPTSSKAIIAKKKEDGIDDCESNSKDSQKNRVD